jgi:hypothetical protein
VEKKSPKRINWHESANNLSVNKAQNEGLSSSGQKNLSKSTHRDEECSSPAPGRMIE